MFTCSLQVHLFFVEDNEITNAFIAEYVNAGPQGAEHFETFIFTLELVNRYFQK